MTRPAEGPRAALPAARADYEVAVHAGAQDLLAAPGEPLAAACGRIASALATRSDPETASDRTYLDTFDWRVHREQAALYLDERGDASTLTWSGAEGDLLAAPNAGGDAPPRFAWDLPPGALRTRLEDVIEMRALLPLVRTRTRTRMLRLLNDDGKTVARIAVDEPRVVRRGDRPVRHRALAVRVRVIPVRGYPRAAERARAALADAGFEPATGTVVAEALAAVGQVAGSYSSKLLVPLDPRAPAGEAVRTLMRALLTTLRANEAGVRDATDTEFLHDYRVAVRRTRSALRQLGSTLPAAEVTRFRDGFRWLGDITTPVRDLDVHVLELDGYRAALEGTSSAAADLAPLEALLLEQQAAAHAALVRAMRTARYRTLLHAWEALLAEPGKGDDADDAPEAATPVLEVASRRIRKVHRTVVRDGAAIDAGSPPEALHDLRKRAKELRYLLELFVSLYPRAAMTALIRELKALQDNLGAFQDLEVQMHALTAFGQELVATGAPAESLMAMGLLVDQLRVRQRDARDEFADRFASFASKQNRALVAELFAEGSA